MSKSTKLTREEELLLQDFSRNVSAKSSALFYGIALIVSLVPIWLYWRIHQVDLLSLAPALVVGTIVNTWLIAFSYKNVKFVLKNKIAQKREEAVSREVLSAIGKNDTSMGKKEKDERILWKKNVVSEYEATTYSIFYNNALFYTSVILLSFYVLRTTGPNVNYLISVVGSGGLVALFSTGSK